ncbi:MAG: hypothetical protein J6T63_02140, partial [Bacteroidales bacterium]|nr:hypothetical protein [Bacteroidales bacterium]
LSSIGDNGANLKTLMEKMRRKDRKGFIITYITPNVEANYIAMLYPEVPNHPMQSYYLTEKGRELLGQLFSEKLAPITPTTPSTSGKEKLQGKRLETFLSSIGNDGANIKTLMERMKRKDKKSFVNTYINPNLESGYITMLYPDVPNHPMQSYHLTEKGLEILRQFTIRISK